ncbi:MAG: hypothetical protein JST42_08170 [Bacteroidetes bacterium]|nr:hypothetical protein [Bacteroidota bacterium]
MPIAVSRLVYLGFDIYFMVTLFFILKDILKKELSAGTAAFIFLSSLPVMYQLPDLLYFIFFLACLCAYIKQPGKYLFLVQAAILSTVLFYLKVSDGFVAVFLFVVAEGFLVYRKRKPLKVIGIELGCYVVWLVVTSWLLNVDLIGYVRAGAGLIGGFGEAMYLPLGEARVKFGYAAVLISLLFVLSAVYAVRRVAYDRAIREYTDELFIHVILLAAVFYLFKAGFVRADGHIQNFFFNISLVAGLMFVYRPKNVLKRISAFFSIAVLVVSIWALNESSPLEPYLRLVRLSLVTEKIEEIRTYFREAAAYEQTAADLRKTGAQESEVKKVIGDSTADIYPYEIFEAFSNGLKYAPRPVIQSYSSYTEYLDGLNYSKYLSAGAPDYIVYNTASIDGRYPFFDEPRTGLAILRHYSVAGQFKNESLLLKKRQAVSDDLHPVRTDTINGVIGKEIPVTDSVHLQYARIYINYNPKGDLRKLLYQPPPLWVTFRLDNGAVRTFRVVRPVLAEGVLINKFIDNNYAFRSWLKTRGRSNRNIKSIRFDTDMQHNVGKEVLRNFRIINTYYDIRGRSAEEMAEDSLNEIAFDKKHSEYFSTFRAVRFNGNLYGKGNFQYAIDKLLLNRSYIDVEGWAFRTDTLNTPETALSVVLRSESGTYRLPSAAAQRPDLVQAFQRLDVLHAGFAACVGTAGIPAGNYQLGLSFVGPDSNCKRIVLTDQIIPVGDVADAGEPAAGADERSARGGIDKLKARIESYIDTIEDRRDHVFIRGWAYVKGWNSRQTSNRLIFKGDKTTYVINAVKAERRDVAEVMRDTAARFSGFSLLLSKQALPEGCYRIGICASDQAKGNNATDITGKTINLE